MQLRQTAKSNHSYFSPETLGIKIFQEGGDVMVEETAPAGGDPLAQIMGMAQQAVQAQDGAMALQVCEMLVQMAGGGAPAEAQPMGDGGMYKKGGVVGKEKDEKEKKGKMSFKPKMKDGGGVKGAKATESAKDQAKKDAKKPAKTDTKTIVAGKFIKQN